MAKRQKRVLAVHDISCFGKCSLTVALPILSAAGIETSVIPTAVLSTHTGGFTGYTFRDLTNDIPAIARHWKSLGLTFDAIYTGYLGSFRQLALVSRLIDEFRGPDTLVCVDPAMADNGKLYPAFGPDFPAGMAKLCAKADLVVPNLTEAALMLGEPYREGPYDKGEIEGLLRRLCAPGPRRAVLTGVWFRQGSLGCAAYDAAAGKAEYAMAQKIAGSYHGTGDIFASALLGALMDGLSLSAAAQAAVDFTAGSIRRTFEAKTDVRFGVNFEAGLPAYMRSLGLG
ncbi:MAG TPA: pyridoxamine kinase [Ruminococcaceae bacterium]|jgi:pyridoxine kinase|nr:pyridoxamine kinase [Oscillospiraceae bacterium]HBT90903.1 pyridoxamine kinase [Oscillospiraceae bacterium]